MTKDPRERAWQRIPLAADAPSAVTLRLDTGRVHCLRGASGEWDVLRGACPRCGEDALMLEGIADGGPGWTCGACAAQGRIPPSVSGTAFEFIPSLQSDEELYVLLDEDESV